MSRLCVQAKIPEVDRPRWEARRRSPHLPGEPQAADGGVVQPHDNGVEGQQILVLLAAAGAGGGVSGRGGGVSEGREGGQGLPLRGRPHSHGRDLDELLEQLRALARGLAEQHLGGHPVGDLAAALQQQLEVGRLPAAALPVEHVVHELQLQPRRQKGRQGVGWRRGAGDDSGRRGARTGRRAGAGGVENRKSGDRTRCNGGRRGGETTNINNTLPSTESLHAARRLNHLIGITVSAFSLIVNILQMLTVGQVLYKRHLDPEPP